MWLIALRENMSGTRANDMRYPPLHVPFEVDDWEGQNLVTSGVAYRLAMPAPVPPPPLESPASIATAPEPPPSRLPEPPADEPAEAKPVADEDAEPPAPTAPVAAWRAFAISQGGNPGEVNALTKAQLQAVYGGRL